MLKKIAVTILLLSAGVCAQAEPLPSTSDNLTINNMPLVQFEPLLLAVLADDIKQAEHRYVILSELFRAYRANAIDEAVALSGKLSDADRERIKHLAQQIGDGY